MASDSFLIGVIYSQDIKQMTVSLLDEIRRRRRRDGSSTAAPKARMGQQDLHFWAVKLKTRNFWNFFEHMNLLLDNFDHEILQSSQKARSKFRDCWICVVVFGSFWYLLQLWHSWTWLVFGPRTVGSPWGSCRWAWCWRKPLSFILRTTPAKNNARHSTLVQYNIQLLLLRSHCLLILGRGRIQDAQITGSPTVRS